MAKKGKKRKASKNYIPKSKRQQPKQNDLKLEFLDYYKQHLSNWFEKPNLKLITLFAFIYLYFIIRIVFTDIDFYLASRLFNISRGSYVTGRLLLVFSIISIYWLRSGNKRLIKNFILLVVYPFYPVLFKILKNLIWDLPKKLIRRNNFYFLFLYFDSLISLVVKLKYKVISVLFFLNAIFFMTVLKGHYLLIPIALFLVILFRHLHRRYKETFSPIKVFQLQVQNFKPKAHFERAKFDESISQMAIKAESDKKITKMEYFLLIGELSRVFNQKVTEILDSKTYFQAFLAKAIYSFLLAMIIFGGINYCLYLIDSSHFLYKGGPKYFEFFYYSFFTIFPDGSDIEPITRFSKVIRMFGVLVGVLLNLLILVVLITVRSERYKENLQALSNWSLSYAEEITVYFEEKYGRKTVDALKYLVDSGSALSKGFYEFKQLLK
ncbi:hypothetical protein [Membranihabitans maritimus]|uniref:hypothetical protein n=1 Tax=Membranihabitans maritimus TaxID=2904244 RepID=UPI001F16DDBF|nr:hypothetical protein [Membranihabitans maritimus]